MASNPSVAAVMPARNEAAVAGRSVQSLAVRRYGGEFRIILVDDQSSDGTAQIAQEADTSGRLTVIAAGPPPKGWTGKLWAVSQGVKQAGPHTRLRILFFLLYPPAWIRGRRRQTAGAAGGCMLIRRETLERIGCIEAIRGELIDDCALARAVKRAGGMVWLGLTQVRHQ